MHYEFLNAEPALFPLLLHCLYPDIPSSTLLPLDLILYPGSSQGARKSPILWHNLCHHTPSFVTASLSQVKRRWESESDLHGSTTNRSPITCSAALGLLRGRHRLPPGAGISLQRYLRDQHDSRPSQASQARRLTSPGYLFALASRHPPNHSRPREGPGSALAIHLFPRKRENELVLHAICLLFSYFLPISPRKLS